MMTTTSQARAKPRLLLVSKALPLAALAALTALSACTGNHDRAPRAVLDVAPHFEELSTEVPRGFSDAKNWNQARICPEGSQLTPFTRYDFEAGQKNAHGFKHYFGRSCAIIHSDESILPERKLASQTSSSETPPSAISIVPHGPFIWWYETGKRMEMGSFENGTLSSGSSRYEPDGTIAVVE